jgi:hypothetical protein
MAYTNGEAGEGPGNEKSLKPLRRMHLGRVCAEGLGSQVARMSLSSQISQLEINMCVKVLLMSELRFEVFTWHPCRRYFLVGLTAQPTSLVLSGDIRTFQN